LLWPLGDGVNFALYVRFRFWSVELNRMIECAPRIITDLGSVPGPLKLKFPPWSRLGACYVLHDRCYFEQDMTRAQADNVLREAGYVLGADEADVEEVYEGVHLFGQAAWDRNAALKASGYRRQVTGVANFPYASAA
jgi:hypothetical protein